MSTLLSASRQSIVLILALTMGACSGSLSHTGTGPADTPALNITWAAVDSLNAQLPETVQVLEGWQQDPPLRMWRVDVARANVETPVQVLLSEDEETRRSSVEAFAKRTDACVAVNGGYFTMDQEPAHHVGLLALADSVAFPATGTVRRGLHEYETARAAIGFAEGAPPEYTWASTRGDSLFSWSGPPALPLNGTPPHPTDAGARHWPVDEAMGAGPMLVTDGQISVTRIEEFMSDNLAQQHPRTAVGMRPDGTMMLFVVDGRQDESVGVTLDELAAIAHEAGAEHALNLDGGGSATLVVQGHLINRPAGSTIQRPVVSALGVYCD